MLLAGLVAATPVIAAEYQTLDEAWAEAYRNNPSLEAERAKLRATDEQVAQALSHWRPSVSLNANVTRTMQHTPSDSGLPAVNYAENGDSYGAEVKQPLFRGFRTLLETEEAEKQVKAGRAQLQVAEQQLLLDTAKAFLDTVRDEGLLRVDRDETSILQKKIDETTARAKMGDLSQTDVRQAKSRLARAEVTVAQAEATLTSDRASFLRLVGEEPGSLRPPLLDLKDIPGPDDVLHRAETENPSVVSAQYTVDAAKANIDLNKGALLPEIDLVGSSSNAYGQSITFPGREVNSQVMVQLTLPLYDGGADYSKIRAARQVASQKRMELEEARHKAHETARNAVESLQAAEDSLTADEAEVKASAEALEGVKVEARVGNRTTIDVLNAEQELLDAKSDLLRAEHDRDYAVLQIKSAVGQLTADALKLDVERYDPERHYDDNAGKLAGLGDDGDYVLGSKNRPATNE